ncbi:oxidoreductase [Desulfonema ishimotonii]|uniref:Oxidoreductase n=1 Tax=Desulfonema ishimotonii TaxID=45657 RepID=A0A401FWW1_9BACT|nr:FAD-dependent oxidoreductase [Desulfonema ishimotonii]GBC61467.1 oxidoreductase [Desulfonema ishimotonii]
MAKVIFGAWDNNVIDNRRKKVFEIEEHPEFSDFDEFNPGNPIKAFFGGHGFFIFEKNVNLLDAALQYMERVATESCGKCTPCRVGTQIIKSKLEALTSGQGTPDMLDEIESIAEHVRTTSLCGLGQTATVSLLEMLKFFREELEAEIAKAEPVARQHCTTYVSAPCIEACPSKVDVPRYIDYIKDGKFTHSLGVILQKYPMAATCGRVCVRFCEMACRRTQVDEAVGIKVLKRFVADHEQDMTNEWFSSYMIPEKKDPDLKVAVIGTGPAGIAAAYHLLLRGYPVDVYEAKSVPGGMAATGIPEYRLPNSVLNKEISIIETMGGQIFYNRKMGRDFTVKSLFSNGYKSIFLAIGTHKGKMMRAAGEDPNLDGYDFGVDFLLRINHDYIDKGIPMKLGEKMVVVGGGNVAMDCVRSALRMGVKEVHLVYRRSRREMPADHEEVEAAEKEGVIFHFLTHPTKILSEDGKVKGVGLIEMALGEPDESGRRSVTPVDGSDFVLETDHVIPAIGQQVELGFVTPDEDGVAFNSWGTIKVRDDSLMSTRKGVFAGGDCVTGPATLVQAMAQGEQGARCIDDYLTYGRVRFFPKDRMSQLVADVQPMIASGVNIPVKHEYRVKVRELDPDVRKQIFEEVEKPISVEEAYHEAHRCMRCYRVYSVITEQ